jgi:hypothetical protein
MCQAYSENWYGPNCDNIELILPQENETPIFFFRVKLNVNTGCFFYRFPGHGNLVV